MSTTNNYEDVPDEFRVDIPLTIRHRINGVCLDVHHCTIANGLLETGTQHGILTLERRGVSRRYVSMTLDPDVHPWALPGQEYRARLTNASAEVAKELDDYFDRPQEHKRLKRLLREMANQVPDGIDTLWRTITLVAPCPSDHKGYRSGSSGRTRGRSHSPVSGAPARRYKAEPMTVKTA